MDVGKEALGSPVELEYAVDLDKAENGKPSFFILQIKPMMGTGGEYTFDTDQDFQRGDDHLCRKKHGQREGG